MQLEITIYDAAGNIVVHDLCEAQTATQEEIDAMVQMIEGGCPASIAASVIVNSR